MIDQIAKNARYIIGSALYEGSTAAVKSHSSVIVAEMNGYQITALLRIYSL